MKAIYRMIIAVPSVIPTVMQGRVDTWDHNRPLLSIVIPCYNYGRYISDMLRSLEMQTFKDFEIIVVDDGSNEELTLRVLDDIRKKGTKVLRQRKLNVATALNFGIRTAQGRYVCCVAADDRLEPTYVEKCLCLLESNPGVAIVYSLARTFGDENRIWITEPFDLRVLLEYNYICAAAVFRKSVWEHVGGFDEAIDGYEDWDFWLKAGKAGFRGRLIPEPLFDYRRHGATLNIRADWKRRDLTRRIRENHADFYSQPERTKEVESSYRDVRVPKPFFNLSLKSQYRSSGELKTVIIASARVARKYLQTTSTIVETDDRTCMILATIEPEPRHPNGQSNLSTHFYELDHFLDHYCHLDFLLNMISSRSVRLVVLWESVLAYEWVSAIKSDYTVSIINVIGAGEYVQLSAMKDRFIDLHLVLSDYAMRSLVDEFGVQSEKVQSVANVKSSDSTSELTKVLTYARTRAVT